MKQKGLPPLNHMHGFAHIFLLIAIVLVGIAGIGYYSYKNGLLKYTNKGVNSTSFDLAISNNSQEIPEDWIVYDNLQWGYRIKYPSDWRVGIGGNSLWGPPISSETDFPKNTIDISIANRSFEYNWQDYANSFATRCVGICPEEGEEVVDKSKYKLIPPTIMQKSSENLNEYYEVVDALGETSYLIPVIDEPKYFIYVSKGLWPENENGELYKKIFSTFQLIKRVPTNEPLPTGEPFLFSN